MARNKFNKSRQNGTTEDLRDLGFGSRVSEESSERLLNRDGSFNVERTGLSFFQSLNLYHSLLTMSWNRFYLSLLLGYIVVNAIFASAFVLCGPDALTNFQEVGITERWLSAFFFSVQTFTTVGYGAISPSNISANVVAALDAFVGLVGFALATGLLFARFSRPTAKIMYSSHGLIAPYRGINAFMFRIANQRKSQLIEVEVTLLFTRLVMKDGGRRREYYQLNLERSRVSFFPLHWTIVHPIDEESPLYNIGEEEFRASNSEFLILISATDDTFAQTVHSRSSYRHNEVVWNAKFADPFQMKEDGTIGVDLKVMHKWEQV
ncbi:MAG: ion channel [Candidatus Kapaibacterium sp.]